MLRLASTKIIRLTLVPLLVCWIAGMPCLFGCEIGAQAATTTERHSQSLSGVVSADASCGSAESHACCAQRRASSETEPAQQAADTSEPVFNGQHEAPSGSIRDCPMGVNATAVIGKVRYEQGSPVALTPDWSPPLRVVDQHIPLSEPLRLPNRGHTYLRCCVFLI